MSGIKYNNQQIEFFINNTQCTVTTSSVYFLNPRVNISNLSFPTLTVTSSTILNTDYYHIIASGSSITLTLPNASGISGKEYYIFNRSATTTVITSSGSPIDNISSFNLATSVSAKFVAYENKWWAF